MRRAFQTSKERSIRVIFRYDDYSSLSSTNLEERIIKSFEEHSLSFTIGVIPTVCSGNLRERGHQELVPLTPVKLNILKKGIEAGTVDVALHGYSHQTAGKNVWGHHTEFGGVEREVQRRKIVAGKTLLEESLGREIKTFIPPWNSYDVQTLQVLEQSQFTCISSGQRFYGVIKSNSLKYLPATCGLLHLKEAIRFVRMNSDPAPIIVVLFHQFDFREGDQERGRLTISAFSGLLAWINGQRDVQVTSIEEILLTKEELGASRFLLNHSIRKYKQFMPKRLQGIYPVGIYFTEQAARTMRIRVNGVLLLFYLALLISVTGVVFQVSSSVLSEVLFFDHIIFFGATVLLALFIARTLWIGGLDRRGAIFFTILSGASVGKYLATFVVT